MLATHPNGHLRAVLGTMGGDSQPQILLQVLARILVTGATAGDAVKAPRWRLGEGGFDTWDGTGPEQLHVEHDASSEWDSGLTERGHDVVRSPMAPDHSFGHAQAIVVDDGVLQGAADPRALIGAAAGY